VKTLKKIPILLYFAGAKRFIGSGAVPALGAILLAGVAVAYAGSEDLITYSDLTNNISLILPQETAIDPLEHHTYWRETGRNKTLYGIEAKYEAIYNEMPAMISELPTMYLYVIPYGSEEALQSDFSSWIEDEKFTSGDWELLDVGVNSFSYKTGVTNASDLFMTYSTEADTLHYITQIDNLLTVVNLYRGGGQYNKGNVFAYEEYVSDYEPTLEVMEGAANYIREAIDFFLDDITPIGPPAEYDYYLTSSDYNLDLESFHQLPQNGSISFDIYLDDTSEIGTILDTSGIKEAPSGSISLGINENAILDYNFYAPESNSDCRDSSGWHHIYTDESVDLYEWTNVRIEFGEELGMKIYINEELSGECGVYEGRSEETIYLGDYPEDIIEESFVGYIKNLQTEFSVNESGQAIDEINALKIFEDVSVGDEYAEAIAYLKDNGVIGGYSDSTFRPDQGVNRVETLKILLTGFNYEITGEKGSSDFTDVDYESWYAPYVEAAFDWGYISGYGDGTFKPGQPVNRVEFLKILTKSYGLDLTDYPVTSLYADTELTAWYAPYVQYAKDYALFDIGENFYPANPMTRGEVAEVMYRLLNTNSQ